MAKKIEDKCNEMEKEGYVLISTTITLGAKAILILRNNKKHRLMNSGYIKGKIWKQKTKFIV